MNNLEPVSICLYILIPMLGQISIYWYVLTGMVGIGILGLVYCQLTSLYPTYSFESAVLKQETASLVGLFVIINSGPK